MLAQFSQHITINFSFLKGKKLLIAASGGLDSTVLTHLLKQLDFSIALAHCNFNLRENESNIDQEFVSQLAANLNAHFYLKLFDTLGYSKSNKLSIQVAARELRYEWFKTLVSEHGYDYVITAHQANDNFETFLINSIRGTGLDGLLGIPVKNEHIVRPLLPYSRAIIENYAKNNGIDWREDSSNSETKYARNKIRHTVIPILKELNPNLLSTFKNTLQHLNASKNIVEDRVQKISKKLLIEADDHIRIDIKKIRKLTYPKAYLYELLKDYKFPEWNDVYHLLDAQVGKQVQSTTHRLIKDRAFLLLSPIVGNESTHNAIFIKTEDEICKVGSFNIRLSKSTGQLVSDDTTSVKVDLGKLKFPLSVRKWKRGDYFYPFGMGGKKRLSKFFKDEKMSLLEKEKIWLLCSDNQIVWIIGKRLDNRFRVTNNTKQTLKIERLS